MSKATAVRVVNSWIYVGTIILEHFVRVIIKLFNTGLPLLVNASFVFRLSLNPYHVP